MKNSRKGFTLVELLIVIVVIGVLSTMMMLSSTEAVSSAKASNIISNLRNLKTAALAWYADNLSTADASGFTLKDKADLKTAILKYMTNGDAGTDANSPFKDYSFEGTTSDTWFVKYSGADVTGNSRVVDKLNGRRTAVGINGAASKTDTAITASSGVFMYVR